MDLRNGTFRKFRTEDAEAVSRLIRNNLLNTAAKDYSEEIINRANDQLTPKFVLSMSNKRKMYVAVEGNKVVGTASIDHDEISNVYVDADYHTKGIDRRLIQHLEEIAANNGFKLVKLITMLTLQKRYEKLGYEVVKEIDSEMLGKEILMEKFLD